MSNKVWFITGASRGFGRIWADAALSRGHRVAATARSLSSLADLREKHDEAVLPLEMDVTKSDQVAAAVEATLRQFGQLDVVINNAGYALVGTVEEAAEADVKAEFETNFYGALRVIQQVLPILREQRSGHILGVSSVSGLVAHPISGMYSASKWAFEAMHESLSHEVAGFGVKVTILEPGAYATDFSSISSLKVSDGLAPYADLRAQAFVMGSEMEYGDPEATGGVIVELVESDNPPLRFFVGTEGFRIVKEAYAERLALWEHWKDTSTRAQGSSRRVEIKL